MTDARATMAIYRLHRKEWEKGIKPLVSAKKRKQADPEEFPGGGRRGVSSGLSTVTKAARPGPKYFPSQGQAQAGSGTKNAWWKELNGKSKGGMKA